MKKILKTIVSLLLVTLLLGSCSNALLSQAAPVADAGASKIAPADAPTGLEAYLKRPTTLGLWWDADPNAVSYKIYGAGKVIEQAHTVCFFYDLTYGATYDFYVTSIHANGYESLPSLLLTETMDSPLTVPTGLTAVNVTETSIELTWDLKDEPIRVYGIYVSGGKGMHIGATTNSYLVEGLEAGVEYIFSVESVGFDNSRSDVSEKIYVTTALPYPQWDGQTTYLKGDRVVYNGDVYEAVWWSYADVPGSVVDGAWALVQ